MRARAFATLFALASLTLTPAQAERVRVEGSDTIGGSLGIALAEAFHERNPSVDVEWEGLGSSTAFVGLFDRSADLGASSREINEAEIAEAKRLGIRLQEFVIAYDGMAVVVHPDNPVRSLTIAQLSDIFQGRLRRWREVGGPDRAIRLISRPSYSGTHAFFRDRVLRRGNARGPEQFAETTEWVEHSADISLVVAEDPGAISYVGLAYVTPRVRAVPVAWTAGQPALLPSVETVRRGTYPIYRPLLLYSPGTLQNAARRLVDFTLSAEGQSIVSEVGFVPTEPIATSTAPQALPVAIAVESRGVESAGFRAALQAQDARRAPAPAAPPAPRAELLRVYFGFGAALLTDEARENLAAVAARLRDGGFTVRIVGHADSRGSSAANRSASAARAQAVFDFLRGQGVAPSRMAVEVAGSDRPIATNETPAGRRGNRRADVLVLPEP